MNVKEILQKNSFVFKKKFGQNFITDTNLLAAIVLDAQVTDKDTVIEVGAGAGTLTKELCAAAKRVIAFEVDKYLEPVLCEVLGQEQNAQVVFEDVLKLSDQKLLEICGNNYKVVANLPYYITTPLIFRFLECAVLPKSITVMVQKEVAERLTAKENTAEYGAVTVAVQSVCDVKITRIVSRKLFFPEPNVDSAVIRLDINLNKYATTDRAVFSRLVKAAFSMRRKTLVNNLMQGMSLSREKAQALLAENNIDINARGEVLSVEQFVKLSNNI